MVTVPAPTAQRPFAAERSGVAEPAPVAERSVAEVDPMSTLIGSQAERYQQMVVECLAMEGAREAAVFDVATGTLLAGAARETHFDTARAASGSAALVRETLATLAAVGIAELPKDVLISFTEHFHIVGSVQDDQSVYAFIGVDKAATTYALTRLRFAQIRSHGR